MQLRRYQLLSENLAFFFQARNIMLRDREEGEDVITGLKRETFFGRPQWDGIFSKIAESNPR
jgi:hypothetical protein